MKNIYVVNFKNNEKLKKKLIMKKYYVVNL